MENKKVSEICDFTKGKKVNTSKEKGKTPYLLIDTLRGAEPEYFTDDANLVLSKPNDILIVMDGANSGLIGSGLNGAVGSTIGRLRPKENLIGKYLMYFLSLNFQNLNTDVRGSAIPHVKKNKLLELKLRFPKIKEQQKIVKEIEKQFARLDKSIKSLQEVKEKVEKYKQSVLKSAFEGELIKFDNQNENIIGNVCVVNPPKSEINDLDKNLYITFLPMKSVSEEGLILTKENKKINEVYNNLTYFKDSDIILAKITPCFENGKMAIVENLENGIGFGSTEFHVIRTKGNLDNKYLFYFFKYPLFRNFSINKMTGSAGQKRVPKKIIENFKIKYPSIKIQEQIVREIERRFSTIENVRQIVDESIKKTEKLGKSILKLAFEGSLIK